MNEMQPLTEVKTSNNTDEIRLINKWAELLLDTGKRNNLISFRDTKSSSVEFVFPSADDIFRRILTGTSCELFNPSAKDDYIDDEDEQSSADNLISDKAIFIAKYSSKVKNKSQLLAYNKSGWPIPIVSNIDKKSKAIMEETGVNVAYVSFGFVKWYENEKTGTYYNAPLLLIPVSLSRESLTAPYYICGEDDEVVVNPTFSYKLEAEYGIKLPEYEDEGLLEYLDKVRKLVRKLGWEVNSECKLGLFAFLKINMYNDLKSNADLIIDSENVRILMGKPVDSSADYSDKVPETMIDPLIDLHNVVDADSSQLEAIELASQGKSFVLQGPPGTGKSQTITNIIAECLFKKKKVLFVSEKKAALDVVYGNLKKVGLEDFCLELHSHKANKKEFIDALNKTIRGDHYKVSKDALNEIKERARYREELDKYANELHLRREGIGLSLYQLYEKYSSFRNSPDISWKIEDIESADLNYYRKAVSTLEQYADYALLEGMDYKANPWYGYNKDSFYYKSSDIIDILQAFRKEMNHLIDVNNKGFSSFKYEWHTTNDIKNVNLLLNFASSTRLITPKLFSKKALDSLKRDIGDIKSISKEVTSRRSTINGLFEEDIYSVDGKEMFNKLSKLYSGFFTRLFNKDYKELIKSLSLKAKSNRKLSYKEALRGTERLAIFQKSRPMFDGYDQNLMRLLSDEYDGVDTDWDALEKEMEGLNRLADVVDNFEKSSKYMQEKWNEDKKLMQDVADDNERTIKEIARASAELRNCFDDSVIDFENNDVRIVNSRVQSMIDNQFKLENWTHINELLNNLKSINATSFLDECIKGSVKPKEISDAFSKLYYRTWIEAIIASQPVLSSFNRIHQDRLVESFKDKDREQFSINRALIVASLSEARPELDFISSGSPVGIILREADKKRKQKSIRRLMSEAGEVILSVKPCFLMSPLSISTFLEPKLGMFDVVIFDEASQIFPQDSIGALYRAKKMIIVGDSKQMPPSNFFASTLEVVDDEDESDITDFDSVLDLASSSLRQESLNWHYRSKYESLISFSNNAFYNNRLITFPSAQADHTGIGVDYYHVDGLFDRKSHTNRDEAEYIVDLVWRDIEEYPDRSIGIVAFSVAQQEMIDRLINKRRIEDPSKEEFFKSDRAEPFFVKNLETVQGDERDTIVFSIAYGRDSQGRLLHNFGPLNRSGGERRLNVAVTRAKMNIQVVSSMHYTDIDLSRTSSVGAKLLRDYLNYAENGVKALEESITVSPTEQFDSYFEEEVYDYLKEHGYTVDTQVGVAGYKIDFGLRKKDSSDYVLAIECDGATYHSSKNARDRDRLRQDVLERMGWKFYRIWSTDWFKNKSTEKAKLIEAANNALTNEKVGPVKKNETATNNDWIKQENEAANPIFPRYHDANIVRLEEKYRYYGRFLDMLKEILEIQSPSSVDYVLRQTKRYFGWENITTKVRRQFDSILLDCSSHKIERRGDFLYLIGKEIKMRSYSEVDMKVIDIAPEELADGMKTLLKQNIKIEKSDLYSLLAEKCGLKRPTVKSYPIYDCALEMVDGVRIDGETIIFHG